MLRAISRSVAPPKAGSASISEAPVTTEDNVDAQGTDLSTRKLALPLIRELVPHTWESLFYHPEWALES